MTILRRFQLSALFRVFFSAALLSLPLCIHAVEPTPEMEALFQKSNEQLDKGAFAEAIEGYNRILEELPEAGNVWINRAMAKWNLRDMSGARADIAQAIHLDPANAEAYRVRAGLRREAGDRDQAVTDMDRAVELVPDNPWYFGVRAELHAELGQDERAVADLNRAIELDGTFLEAFYLRATVFERLDDADAAVADYSRVLEIQPEHADAANQRAWLRFHRLDWEGALGDGTLVMRLAPKAPIAVRLVGYVRFGQGDFAEAAHVLGQASDLEKEDPASAAYSLLVRHVALLRRKASDARLAETWETWSSDPWVQGLARFVLGKMSEEEIEALAAAAEEGTERDGRLCEAHFYIGQLRLLAGDRSTARLRFKAAVATGVKSFVEYTLAEAELRRL